MERNPIKCGGLGYFNLARGLGMVLIIVGHSINRVRNMQMSAGIFGGAGTILGGGIIAAFFMISGFGFYCRKPRKCFNIQKKLLLRPYFCVAAAVLITKFILAVIKKRSFFNHGGEMILTYMLGLNGEGGGSIGGIPIDSVSILWFILALFVGWMIYNGCMLLQSEWLRNIIVIFCVILSYILTLISKVWPFCFPMGLLAVGYLAIGDYIRKKQLLEKKIPWWTWIGILMIVFACAAFGNVNIVVGVWKLGLLDVLGSFCSGFILLQLYARFMKLNLNNRIIGLLEEIGFNSIWIVCLHAYEKIIFPWYRIYEMFPNEPWLAIILCFLSRCAVMYLMYRIVVVVRRIIKKTRRKEKITIEL